MLVIDWNKDDVLNYLGMYFPISYAEAYFIMSDFLSTQTAFFANQKELYIFDFGSGTGGEIFGLLDAIKESLPHVEKIKVKALDGNQAALQLLEQVLSEYCIHTNIEITLCVSPIKIEDIYDLSILRQSVERIL